VTGIPTDLLNILSRLITSN